MFRNLSAMLLATTALVPTAYAQQAPATAPATSFILEGISVVGDWLGDANEEVIRNHPGARQAVRDTEFNASGATTVTEAIRAIPGVQSPPPNGTGGGDFATNIGIRGMTSRLSANALLLLDGIPASNAPYGQPETSLMPVSLGSLQAIDVVRGGGAVRYGPNNVGGVINFVTKDIPKKFGGELTLRGDMVMGGAADNNTKGKADLVVGGSTEAGSGAALLYSGNHGAGFRQNERQDIDDFMVKYRAALTESSRIEGRVHTYKADAMLPGPLSQAAYNANPFGTTHSYEAFHGSRDEVVGSYINEFDGTWRFELTGYYTESLREFTLANAPNASITALDRLPRTYEVFGIEPNISTIFQTGALNHAASFGYRYINEATNEMRYRRSGAAGFNPYNAVELINRDTNGKTDAHSLFVDDRIDIGKVSITPGLRFENVEVERRNKRNGFVDRADYQELLPSLNVGWQVTPEFLAFASYGTSFTPVTHLALSDGTVGAGAQTHLQPEKAKTYELGGRYRAGGLKLDGNLFWIDFENQIETTPTSNSLNVNTGATQHKGIELAAQYEFGQALPGFSLFGTYTYTEATREQGPFAGKDLRLYSPHVATFGGRYTMREWTFNLNSYYQSAQFSDEANTTAGSADGKTGKIPAYGVLNGQVAYDFAPGRTVALGMTNILDERYYTRASVEANGGIFVGAPRTAYIQTKFKF